MHATAYRFATIAELAAGLRRRRFSSAELSAAVLHDLDRVGRPYNAIATLLAERARAEAERADRRLRRGDAPLLCGIPYGAKDLLAARGGPTTWGAPAFRDRIIDADAAVIARIARRGGVLAAKLAMVELAGGGRPQRPGASIFGQPKNVWDTTRYSGGSSSGSGIAVAAGLLPYAFGTETGGSILGPAAYSGITGLRPTYGLVSRAGAMALSWTLDKVGVLARTAADVAVVLEAVSGADPADPTTVRRRFRPARPSAATLRRVRVAYAEVDVEESESHARRALAAAVEDVRRIAPRFVRAGLPAELPYASALETTLLAEGATVFAEHLEDPSFTLVDAKQLAELRAGLAITARDYLHAMRLRTVVAGHFRELFQRADVILSVARTGTAPPLEGPAPRRGSATVGDRLRAAGNLAGLPGVFFPCGLAEDGLPVGLQLVGPPFSEPLLIALASAFQRETGHHLRRPPVG